MNFFFFFFSVLKNWVFSKLHIIMEKYSNFDVGFVHICIKKICLVGHIHE
jgi:hypothetical protein